MSNRRNYNSNNLSFKSIRVEEKDSFILRFLYKTMIGRCILWILIRPWISKLVGSFLNTKLSSLYIKSFIQKNNLLMERFEKRKYSSFNSFFKRKLLKSLKATPSKSFCAPCDGKLSVFSIDDNLVFKVKNSVYNLESLLKDKELAKQYQNGYCLIFRLTPDDYHRYHFIDDGKIISTKKIKGVLHTVRPIALEKYSVFTENSREVTCMQTNQFGTITQIEVGALMVGKIMNNPIKQFSAWEEKGTFLFGGSTIILLVEKNKITLNPEFLQNTQNNLETIVHVQDFLGTLNRSH